MYSKYGWKITALHITQEMSQSVSASVLCVHLCVVCVPKRAAEGTVHHDVVVNIAEISKRPLAGRELSKLIFIVDGVDINLA
jgi:hypothetical protein